MSIPLILLTVFSISIIIGIEQERLEFTSEIEVFLMQLCTFLLFFIEIESVFGS